MNEVLALSERRADSASLSAAPAPAEAVSQLRFLTCGSVDDGKSTLIGRLLAETGNVPDDQFAALARDSRQHGTREGQIDYALLLDGLSAEREQGITIDVAYRFFATPRRRFIVADTPGHKQYTRNMATGASMSDLAVLLVDARRGVLPQTRRHCLIVALLGIRHVVLAVNKMDLVEYDQARFEGIFRDFQAFAAPLGFADIRPIPVAAASGENVVMPSTAMPWYAGPSLLEHLETVEVPADTAGSFRMAVQWVNRPSPDFRGFSGTVARGTVRPGDRLRACPGDRVAAVARIVTADGDLQVAGPGQAVTLVLDDEIDVSRGDLLAPETDPPAAARSLTASLVWVDDTTLVPDQPYWLKLGTAVVAARARPPREGIDVDTGRPHAIDSLALNEIGRVTLDLDRAIAVDRYTSNRETGGFVLIDRLTNATVAVGMVESAGARPARKFELAWRSLAKAVTWRVMGTIGTVMLTYAYFGESRLAAEIGGIEWLTKTFLYYAHERAWARLRFGLTRPGRSDDPPPA